MKLTRDQLKKLIEMKENENEAYDSLIDIKRLIINQIKTEIELILKKQDENQAKIEYFYKILLKSYS